MATLQHHPGRAHDLRPQLRQALALFGRRQDHGGEGGGALGDSLEGGGGDLLALALLQFVGLGQDDLVADRSQVEGVEAID